MLSSSETRPQKSVDSHELEYTRWSNIVAQAGHPRFRHHGALNRSAAAAGPRRHDNVDMAAGPRRHDNVNMVKIENMREIRNDFKIIMNNKIYRSFSNFKVLLSF